MGWWAGECVRKTQFHGGPMGSGIVAVRPMARFWTLLGRQHMRPGSEAISLEVRRFVEEGLRDGFPVTHSAAELFAFKRGSYGRVDSWVLGNVLQTAADPSCWN